MTKRKYIVYYYGMRNKGNNREKETKGAGRFKTAKEARAYAAFARKLRKEVEGLLAETKGLTK